MIEANQLTMHYGSFVALQPASFTVNQGEVVGLLGPNGAGKSTTMKILTTFLAPTKGSATVAGHSVTAEPIEVRRRIGYLPETLPLFPNMEVSEYLNFVGRARGMSGSNLKNRINWAVDRCGLIRMFRKPIAHLSKGFRQRTALAQALLHDPEVVILDEPTSGLDPRQIIDIRDLIEELAKTKTVILSTHILQEVQALVKRAIIINRGVIVGQGTVEELQLKAHKDLRIDVTLVTAAQDIEAKISAIPEVNRVEQDKDTEQKDNTSSFIVYGAKPDAIVDRISQLAQDNNWRILRLTAAPYSLEETFLALTAPQN